MTDLQIELDKAKKLIEEMSRALEVYSGENWTVEVWKIGPDHEKVIVDEGEDARRALEKYYIYTGIRE